MQFTALSLSPPSRVRCCQLNSTLLMKLKSNVMPMPRIAPGVVGEKIVVKTRVAPAPGDAERMVVGIERLARNVPLQRDVERRKFLILTVGHDDVPIHLKIFVQAPTARTVIHNDVANRSTTQCIVAVENI